MYFISNNLQKSPEYWSVLGFLRFLLAAIVFIGHLQIFVFNMPSFLNAFLSFGGKAAVVCFLLISGLSIGHSYKVSHNGYFKRRFLRIYPLYFFAVLAGVLIQAYLGSPFKLPGENMIAAGVLTSLANFFFLQGFFAITITYNGPLWSLSVEVFFYLLVPILMKLHKSIIYLLIMISMIAFTLLHKEMLWGYMALIYAWAWLMGFLISAKDEFLFIIPFFFLGATVIYLNKLIMAEPLSVVTFAIVVTIVSFISFCQLNIPELVLKIFDFLGELSYPLYLFHMPIYLLLYHFGVRNVWLFLILLLIVIIPINYCFDYLIKNSFWKPIVNYVENRFTKRKSLKPI